MLLEKYSSPGKCRVRCEDCLEDREIARNGAIWQKEEHPCRTCSNIRNTKTRRKVSWNKGKTYSIKEPGTTSYINSSGYIEVWMGKGNGQMGAGKRQDGYRLQHRMVMEDKIGRPLEKKEVVHHLNGIKTDNRPENLMLCKGQAEHRGVHNQLERLSFALLEAGHIYFDEVTQTYKSDLIDIEKVDTDKFE